MDQLLADASSSRVPPIVLYHAGIHYDAILLNPYQRQGQDGNQRYKNSGSPNTHTETNLGNSMIEGQVARSCWLRKLASRKMSSSRR